VRKMRKSESGPHILHKQGDQPCFGRANSASRALDSEKHASTLAICQSPWRGNSGRWFSDQAPPLPEGPQRRVILVVLGACFGVWSQTQVAV